VSSNITTVAKGNSFENLVYRILYNTDPLNIEFYRGSGDRGRDIIVHYVINGVTKKVIIECKNYSTPINVSTINSSINWTVFHKPDLYYIWTNSRITPDTKDYIKGIADQYSINILYEEAESVAKGVKALNNNDKEYFTHIKNKIYNILKLNNINTFSKYEEYINVIADSDHYIVDREDERNTIISKQKNAYYLIGMSGVGKTQIMKSVAKHYYDNGYKIFWHRVIGQNSIEMQNRNLLEALSDYFQLHFLSAELRNYIDTRGFGITNHLISMLKSSISDKMIFIIDDIHKCKKNNDEFIEIIKTIIDSKSNNIIMSGWFNIFDSFKAGFLNKVLFLEVNKLNDLYIEKIIFHYNDQIAPNQIKQLVSLCQGLPINAELTSANELDKSISEDTIFLNDLLSRINEPQKVILSCFVISRLKLENNVFIHFGLLSTVNQLTNMRITKIEGDKYSLNDYLVHYIEKYITKHAKKAYEMLLYYAEFEPVVYLDIIYSHIKSNEVDEVVQVLNDCFFTLVDNGFEMETLSILRTIEKYEKVDLLNTTIKKMIILERIGEYNLLRFYVDITSETIDSDCDDYDKWHYIKARCEYYECNYYNIVKHYFQIPKATLEGFSPLIQTQYLLLVGRIFYILGELRIGCSMYYCAFLLAFKHNFKKLQTKAIHRISIIEEKLRMYEDVILSLTILYDKKFFISSKRKSYSYYRIARCELMLGQTDAAFRHNKESINIKTTINHQRKALEALVGDFT